MSLLNAEKILQAKDRRTKTIEVPEWGGEILIGSPGALDFARLNDFVNSMPKESQVEQPQSEYEPIRVVTTDSPDGKPEIIGEDTVTGPAEIPEELRRYTMTQNAQVVVRYLVACILDPETYRPAFNIEQLEDLGSKNPQVLSRIYDEVLDFLGETKESSERIEKNSAGTGTKGSGGD